ncbi:hypothetical protein SAMN02745121_02814 [Nannocystis exedens]|uniref:N-acetyltransferase domain-containing protein n=2 Tax=Nannocystis exedens TaxID=54 RepID=A0A1I1XF77_9BACT|nr:hypothetical protein [Nannocystis exedens]PCC73457.1 hypothetical protein NAEX_06545 [Nannocystis exedens]SFE06017.1 hypothetical protein SAMN02745121_02814 [Nannocystis exedens]
MIGVIGTFAGFTIRTATPADVPLLAALDRAKFGGAGMEVYGEEHFRCWLDVNPSGLLVATHAGHVVGYRYSQYLDFDLGDIAGLTTNAAFTDHGFTRRTHRAAGNSINGMSVCSSMPGAGRALFEVIFEQLRREGRRYYFGFARIPGFAAYCERLGTDASGIDRRQLATWYALGCARRVGGLVHDGVAFTANLRPREPEAPDPVLSKYLKHPGFGIAAVLPDWIEDPASLNVGVMVLYKNPDLAGGGASGAGGLRR